MSTCRDFATVLIVGVLLASGSSAPAATYFVAPDGNDANPGTETQPFATLMRARDEIRKLKQAGPLKEPVTVHLRGGIYRVDQTIEFTPENSGTQQSPIAYVADPGERPVISGGRRITGWQKGAAAGSDLVFRFTGLLG